MRGVGGLQPADTVFFEICVTVWVDSLLAAQIGEYRHSATSVLELNYFNKTAPSSRSPCQAWT